MNKTQERIWQVIQEMNRKWTVEDKADELKNFFHENMVAITPTDSKAIEGRDNCVAGWKNFSQNAKIHFWKELDPSIQAYGEGRFAIVTYYSYRESRWKSAMGIAAKGASARAAGSSPPTARSPAP